ncbi:hypothetical protein OUZ56_005495 [Daphnia magna]|uniref:Uncharacterized protein n=1 Tax=Daphnia magna TaxID=35525 RepID=A0ABQ9YSZ4_9CRUS|nr:hypothetical protein OUZ56_005495 [Daphnia magna]
MPPLPMPDEFLIDEEETHWKSELENNAVPSSVDNSNGLVIRVEHERETAEFDSPGNLEEEVDSLTLFISVSDVRIHAHVIFRIHQHIECVIRECNAWKNPEDRIPLKWDLHVCNKKMLRAKKIMKRVAELRKQARQEMVRLIRRFGRLNIPRLVTDEFNKLLRSCDRADNFMNYAVEAASRLNVIFSPLIAQHVSDFVFESTIRKP